MAKPSNGTDIPLATQQYCAVCFEALLAHLQGNDRLRTEMVNGMHEWYAFPWKQLFVKNLIGTLVEWSGCSLLLARTFLARQHPVNTTLSRL